MRRFIILGVAGAAALSACSVSDKDEGAEGNNAAATDLTPEGPGLLDGLFANGKPVPLNIQQAHASGLVLQLTSLQAKPTETVIGVTVVNGDGDEQSLNAYPNNKDSYIVASGGEKFYLSPPATNPELSVTAGQRMEGELVFLGRLPQGQSAVLVINDGNNFANQYTNSPGFRIELPLENAFSDDGSKKN